jgi:hypothetical protein
MLEGTTISRPINHSETVGTNQAVQAGASSALFLFLLLLAAISALTCLYVYQLNSIARIQDETWYADQEIARLDLEITPIQLELALLQAPAVIDRESARLGMKTGGPTLRATVPASVASVPDGAMPASPPLYRTLKDWLSLQAGRVGVQLPWSLALEYR